jgi:3-oxoacyl-[acyl-carrier protein] reductase
MVQKLIDKVAFVTGAGRGIGRAIAIKLGSEGAKLVVNDLDAGEAEEVVESIRATGGQAVTCVGNVTHPDFAARFITTGIDAFGGLDIIVNNAGYTWDNVIQKMTDEQWYALIDCHLTAPFRILRAAQPVVKKLWEGDKGRGVRRIRKVVNISSMAGLFGNAGQSGYSAAKSGVVGFTMTLAKEWGRLGVTVNSVAFGLINTRLTSSADQAMTVNIEGRDIKVGVNPTVMERMEQAIPLGRGGTPEEAAGAVYMLCIPESDYVSGQTLICSGGLTGM